jgi:hypothetical protein
MNPISVAGLIVGFLLAVPQASPQVEHTGFADVDRYLLCIRTILGKPVYRDPASFLRQSGFRCPASREELVKDLTTREEVLAEDEKLAFIFPRRLLRNLGPEGPTVAWKRLELVPEPRNFRGIPGTRELSTVELQQIGQKTLAQVRPTPVVAHARPDADGVVRVEYQLRLTAARLGQTAAESIVGILGQPNGAGRVVYGELRNGSYTVRWDSPVINALMFEMGFEDMDGDGVKDILLVSRWGRNGDFTMLSILETEGRELTRQKTCVFDNLWSYEDDGVVCPIVAREIIIDDPRAPTGTRDLLVNQSDAQTDPGVFRYALRGGRYVEIGKVSIK